MTCCLVPKKGMFGLLQSYFIHVGTKPLPGGQGHGDLYNSLKAQTAVVLEQN